MWLMRSRNAEGFYYRVKFEKAAKLMDQATRNAGL